MAATPALLSAVYPLGSTINARGALEIGGCDVTELAEEFGTPAYVVAEDDLRARAKAFVRALAAHAPGGQVVFASKAFPCTAAYRLFASENLGCDVASGGELDLALRAGFPAAQIFFHGNAKSDEELTAALAAGVGGIVIDNDDEISALQRLGARAQTVLLRINPAVSGDTHAAISTGQADSKFGFSLTSAPAAIERVRGTAGLELVGLHIHLGSQLFEPEVFADALDAIATLGDFPLYNVGGGLAVAYTADQRPPSIERWVGAQVAAVERAFGAGHRVVVEPGRALVANGGVTLYRVVSVKRNVSTWVAVDGGMSDNLRPMLYGAPYEVQVANRFFDGHLGAERCNVVGKHCESGDILVRGAPLVDPRPGDLLVTPATGAYGHAMANNYNGVPRPPVIFCRDGNARAVVRRETYADLRRRDL